MKIITRIITATLLLPTCATAPEISSEPPTADVEEMLRVWTKEDKTPGVQYVVFDKNGFLLDTSAGTKDAASGAPMGQDDLLLAFSITKVITAITVLKLRDQGLMALDAPLSRYFSDHPYGTAVTIRMLLNHTSGIPNPAPLDWFTEEHAPLDREVALQKVLAKHGALDSPPGDVYHYGNISYWLLEKAIEAAAKTPYADYVRTHIFEPAGVGENEAVFELPGSEMMATGHIRKYGITNLLLYLMAPSGYWSEPANGWSRFSRVRSHGLGYGGLYCTARAIAKILQVVIRQDSPILSSDSKRLMFETQTTNDGQSVSGTLGWVIGETNGAAYFGKQGGGLGFHGNLRYYPSLGIGTALLVNSAEISAGPIDRRSNELDKPFIAARLKPSGSP